MTIQEVLKNLDTTIKGKTLLLQELEAQSSSVAAVSAQFVRINLMELGRIRDDVAAISA